MLELNQVYNMDCITGMSQMDAESVNACITSPPYWGLRDYGLDPIDWAPVEYSPIPSMPKISIPEWRGNLGLEPTIEMFVGHIVLIFREVRRVLKDDGTLWLNMGDCYHSGNRGGYRRKRAGVSKNMGHSGNYNDFSLAPNRVPQEGIKNKDLLGMPWRIAFALQADSWYLRSDIIWAKPSPMPESVTDRPTKAHEYIFLMSKSEKYWYDQEAIREMSSHPEASEPEDLERAFNRRKETDPRNGKKKIPSGWDQGEGTHGSIHRDGRTQKIHGNLPGRDDGGKACNKPGQDTRNKRTVWTVATQPFSEAHFAVYPEKLIAPCVLAGCRPSGLILDPFMGAGTTAIVAHEYGRDFIGFELSAEYMKINQKRIHDRTRQNLLVGI